MRFMPPEIGFAWMLALAMAFALTGCGSVQHVQLQRVNVPAKRTVKFKVGRKLKDHLDAPKVEIRSEAAQQAVGRKAGRSANA